MSNEQKLTRLVVEIIGRLRDEIEGKPSITTARIEMILEDIQTYALTEFQ